MRISLWPVLLLSFLFICSGSFANHKERPALLSLGGGWYNILRADKEHAQGQIEYKWSASWRGVQPLASLMVTSRAGVYGCFGACYEIFLGKYFVLTPSFAPGLFWKNGETSLGYPLEFRSAVSLACVLGGVHRIGAQFYHISNAKLGHKNPGEESLVIFYGISL